MKIMNNYIKFNRLHLQIIYSSTWFVHLKWERNDDNLYLIVRPWIKKSSVCCASLKRDIKNKTFGRFSICNTDQNVSVLKNNFLLFWWWSKAINPHDEPWKIAQIANDRVSPIFNFIQLINGVELYACTNLFKDFGHYWPSGNVLFFIVGWVFFFFFLRLSHESSKTVIALLRKRN